MGKLIYSWATLQYTHHGNSADILEAQYIGSIIQNHLYK